MSWSVCTPCRKPPVSGTTGGKSQKIVVKTRQTESKIEHYEKMLSNWDDLMTICEMAEEEDDDSMLEELKTGFAALTEDMETCRLETLPPAITTRTMP